MTIAELRRICGYVEVDAKGCWIWTRARTDTGYATAKLGKPSKQDYVHRSIYRTLVGPIPPGLQIDHLCRVRHCINPRHLEAVTSRENTLRGAMCALKTHCRHGHPYTAPNVGYRRDGTRYCRTCVSGREPLSGAYTAPQEGS